MRERLDLPASGTLFDAGLESRALDVEFRTETEATEVLS